MTGELERNVRVIHADDHTTLLKEAAEEGARLALARLGLDTPERFEDFRAVLALGRGVREAQREVWRTVGKAMIWALAIGAAVWISGLGAKLGVKAAALLPPLR